MKTESFPPAIRLLRPHHWIKNGFIAAPLFFTPAAMGWASIETIALGVLAWSLAASAIYILNDLVDCEADRQHPKKKTRPIACGAVSKAYALVVMSVLALASTLISLSLTQGFALCLLAYVLVNLAYSYFLKQIAIIDVMCIALGFVLRVEAGAQLIDVTPSPWIMILTGLLAMFLGFAKRRDDLIKHLGVSHRKSLDGYSRIFIDTAMSLTAGSALVSYLIFTTDAEVRSRLETDALYVTVPFVVFAMLRYLQVAMVEERSGSPTLVFLTDRPILFAGLGWILTFAGLIYL